MAIRKLYAEKFLSLIDGITQWIPKNSPLWAKLKFAAITAPFQTIFKNTDEQLTKALPDTLSRIHSKYTKTPFKKALNELLYKGFSDNLEKWLNRILV